ncbi:EpsG family protein [Acinetobacter baumannii]|uniref:Wzy n=1 Tax=Acinetobacter baumannii TaxID=470 RepID=V5RC94_ACIBA|nr:EpsG family protein [Acinetobacter baumannii]AHB32637.1 Wzy [Acinetobacter baumannii]AHB32715.1 Wzy [Acinetobacter baumannii]MCT9356074.1 EpsG family protein [Acinetobacter baumannii]NDX18963.1 EpsG family protein [Acinetobacter baumannii]NDX37824.1 EpsG family protein [Acinetobacter baumannii]
MIPYLIVLFFVMLITFIESKHLSRRAIIIPSFFLILLSSLRSNIVGTDSRTYTLAYDFNYDPYRYGFDPNIEYGYQLLDSIILNFSHNYFWLFFITSFFIVTFYLTTIKKLSENYIFSIFIYITFGFYTFAFNGLRQGIAMAICFFALPFMLERKFFKYLLFILFSSLFHVASLIMLFFYFLVYLKTKLEYKVTSVLIGSSLLSSVGITYLAQGNDRYQHYTEVADKSGGYLTLGFYVLIGIIVYILGRTERQNNENYRVFEVIFLCGLAFVLPVSLLGTDPSGPQRIFYFFAYMVIFLIPIVLRKLKSKIFKVLFVLLAIVYFCLITSKFNNLVPYILNPHFEVF